MAKKKGRITPTPASAQESFDFLDGRENPTWGVQMSRALCRRLAVTRTSETELIDRLARAICYLDDRAARTGSS